MIMALSKDKDLKMYYSIKEVASDLGVSETTLRYWETMFPQLSPHKGSNGVRRYNKEDLKIARTIYHLVKERGLTLAGAKQHLKGAGNKENADSNENDEDEYGISFLRCHESNLLNIRGNRF